MKTSRIPVLVRTLLAGSVLVGATTVAQAQVENPPQQAYITTFGEYTDNITRTFADKENAVVYGAGAGFDLNSTRRRMQARLQGDLAYLDSDEALYESGVLGNVLGRLNLAAVPERIDWLVEAAYGQIPVDERLSDTPTNRQDFATARTGPTFTIPFSARDLLTLGGSYSMADYSVSLDDYERTEGNLALRHLLTARQRLTLSATTSETQFKREELFADYRQDRALLEWQITGARTTLLVQGGYDVLRAQGDDLGSTLYNVRLTRKIGQASTLLFQVDQQLSDTSSAFARRLDFVGVGGGAVNVSPNAGVFRARSGRAMFRTATQQLEIVASANYEQDRYVNSEELRASDRDVIFSSLSVFKTITPAIVYGVFGDMTNADFIRQDFEYTEWDAGMVLSVRLSRSFGMQLSGAHSKRSGGLERGGFEENVFRLGLYYAIGSIPLDLRERPGTR